MKTKISVTIISLIVVIILSTLFYKKAHPNTVKAKKGNIIEAIYGLGKVKSDRKYEVKIGVMTNVEKLFVKEGQEVKTNDPLIKFRDSGLFRAPFNGTIISAPYHQDETVLPQLTALKMMDLSDRYIEVSLEQQGALRVQKGQLAHVVFESLRGVKVEGVVTAIFPKDEDFLAHIRVENLSPNILPGMSADVAVEVSQKKDAFLIPVSTVNHGQVSVMRNGHRQKIEVEIGAIEGPWAELVKGDLKLDDELVIIGK